MKFKTILLTAVAAALCCACIPSVNPFYKESDVVADSRLQGLWLADTNSSAQETWKFETNSDHYYSLHVTEKGDKKGEFDARLFKIKQEYFLDLTPSSIELKDSQAGLVEASVIPGHLVFHVSQFEPTLKMASFDFDWLKKYIEKNPKALAHRTEKELPILTARDACAAKIHTRPFERWPLRTPGELTRAKTQP